MRSWPELIKLYSCSTQLRMKFVLLIKIQYQQFKPVSCTAEFSMQFFLLTNIKMATIVGILIFISRRNFILNWVEYDKSFITSGPCLMIFAPSQGSGPDFVKKKFMHNLTWKWNLFCYEDIKKLTIVGNLIFVRINFMFIFVQQERKVKILIFISRIDFMPNWVEIGKQFISPRALINLCIFIEQGNYGLVPIHWGLENYPVHLPQSS